MIERLLLLSKTYPEYSKRYYYRICMAGITESGEIRRIYPIPMNFFLKNRDIFKKYNWIEYKRLEKGDSRLESYKVKFNVIRKIKSASYEEIFGLIKNRINSIEKLSELRDQENISLGFIKPNIQDIKIETPEERYIKKKKLTSQLTLLRGTLGDYYIPYMVKFNFLCVNSTNCTGHSIICEDIKFWNFFKTQLETQTSINLIKKRLKEKILNPLKDDDDLIFMIGTHFLFKTWLIISIISPLFFK